MSPRQMFKAAFISRCIDAGDTTPEQMLQRLSKSGDDLFGSLGKGVMDLGKTLGEWTTGVAIAAPPIAGAALGALAARANDAPPEAVDQAKQQEVIDEYHRQADRLRREGALRRFSQAPTAPFRRQALI